MNKDYESLRNSLNENHKWPSVYMFKFIVPDEEIPVNQALNLFGMEADVQIKSSKTGKYISITAKELMLNADSVIGVYERASKIKGLMAL
jgi:hypothetical protein